MWSCGQNIFAPKPDKIPISDDPVEAMSLGEEALENNDYELAKKAFEKIMNDLSVDTALRNEAKKNYFLALVSEKGVSPIDVAVSSGILDALASLGNDTGGQTIIKDVLKKDLIDKLTSTYNGENALEYIDDATGIENVDTIIVSDTVMAKIKTESKGVVNIVLDTEGNLLVDGAPIDKAKALEMGAKDPLAAANAGFAHLLNTISVIGDVDKDGQLSAEEGTRIDSLTNAVNSTDIDSAIEDIYDTETLDVLKENALQEVVVAKLQMEMAIAIMDSDGDNKADDPAVANTFEMISTLNSTLSEVFMTFSDINN